MGEAFIRSASIRVTAIIALLAAVVCLPGASARVSPGEPLHHRLIPDFEGYPQHFGLTRSRQGLLFLATASGIAMHDGVQWSTLTLPGGVTGRTVMALADSDDVLVGAYGDFGRVRVDDTGRLQFESYASLFSDARLDPEIDAVWQVASFKGWYWFRSDQVLYAVNADDQSLWSWRSPHGIGPMAVWDDQLVFPIEQQGLYALSGPHPPERLLGDPLLDARFLEVTRLGDRLIFRGLESQLIEVSSRGVEELDYFSSLPETAGLTSMAAVDETTLAVGSRTGRVYLIDSRDSSVRSLTVSDDRIDELVVDRLGGFWSLTHRDLVHMQWPPAWEVHDSDDGLYGTVNRVLEWPDRLLVASSSGVFELGEDEIFASLDWTDGEAWDLMDTGHGLLLAESRDLRWVRPESDEVETLLEDVFPRALMASGDQAWWLATDRGLWRLEWRLPGQFSASHVLPHGVIRSLVEMPDALWLGTLDQGVIELSLDSDQRIVRSEQHELAGDTGRAAAVLLLDGELTVSTGGGLYRRQQGRWTRLENHPVLSLLEPNFSLATEDAHQPDPQWLGTYRSIVHRHDGQWQRARVEAYRSGAFGGVSRGLGDTIWVGSTSALYRFDQQVSSRVEETPSLLLRELGGFSASGSLSVLPVDQPEIELASGPGSTLRLRLALADYSGLQRAQYRVHLLGRVDQWSDWQESGVFQLTGLASGEYQLSMQARSGRGQLARPLQRTVIIAPLWHETLAGRLLITALVLLLTTGLIIAMTRWRLKSLKASNLRLDRLVTQRTAELEQVNRKLKSLAEHDGLTGLANRRMFDEQLATCFAAWQQQQSAFGLILIDADHFKHYNDAHGHLAGDDLLRQIADCCRTVAEQSGALAARYGGEEFVLLIDQTGEALWALAERLRSRVDQQTEATISLGVAEISARHRSADDVLKAADQALYQAKSAGRNRVMPPLP